MEQLSQTPALDTLSDQLGEMIHNWGFKRIHGRLWTRLFLSNRPLDAADLIGQLGISKALVSISLRELLDVKAVEEVGRSARGTNLFRANQDINSIYLEVLKKRERKMLELTSAALSMLSNLDSATLNQQEVSMTQMGSLASHLEMAMAMLSSYVETHAPPTTETVSSFSQVIVAASPTTIGSQSASQQNSLPFSALLGGTAISMVLPARGG